ncbi:hypothetical protein HDK77DRAFT_152715 [Phyllosticta capitalensis]
MGDGGGGRADDDEVKWFIFFFLATYIYSSPPKHGMVCTCKKTSPLFFPPSPSSPVSSLHPGRGRQPLFHPRPTVRRKPHHHHPIAFFLSCLQYALLRVAVSFFVHMGQCHRHHLLWSDRLMQPTRAQPLPAIWSSPAEGAGADKLFQSHLHHIQVGIHSPCRLTRLVIPLRKQNGPIPSLVIIGPSTPSRAVGRHLVPSCPLIMIWLFTTHCAHRPPSTAHLVPCSSCPGWIAASYRPSLSAFGTALPPQLGQIALLLPIVPSCPPVQQKQPDDTKALQESGPNKCKSLLHPALFPWS